MGILLKKHKDFAWISSEYANALLYASSVELNYNCAYQRARILFESDKNKLHEGKIRIFGASVAEKDFHDGLTTYMYTPAFFERLENLENQHNENIKNINGYNFPNDIKSTGYKRDNRKTELSNMTKEFEELKTAAAYLDDLKHKEKAFRKKRGKVMSLSYSAQGVCPAICPNNIVVEVGRKVTNFHKTEPKIEVKPTIKPIVSPEKPVPAPKQLVTGTPKYTLSKKPQTAILFVQNDYSAPNFMPGSLVDKIIALDELGCHQKIFNIDPPILIDSVEKYANALKAESAEGDFAVTKEGGVFVISEVPDSPLNIMGGRFTWTKPPAKTIEQNKNTNNANIGK